MKIKGLLVCLGAGMILAGCGMQTTTTTTTGSMTTGMDNTGNAMTGTAITGEMKTYTDSTNGFSISYPSSMSASPDFKEFYILPSAWMAESDPTSTGKLLVSIISARMENTASYPRYYDAEVRVGISTGTTEVANCTKYSQEQAPGTQVINGVSFVTYEIQDAAMMQYIGGKTYRIVHNGACYVIDQLKTGSNYMDDHSPSDLPQATLDNYYNSLTDVVASFQFTK